MFRDFFALPAAGRVLRCTSRCLTGTAPSCCARPRRARPSAGVGWWRGRAVCWPGPSERAMLAGCVPSCHARSCEVTWLARSVGAVRRRGVCRPGAWLCERLSVNFALHPACVQGGPISKGGAGRDCSGSEGLPGRTLALLHALVQSVQEWQQCRTCGCARQVRETLRDVQFLHNDQFFAAAQKKYVYIYDKRGIEVHCLKVRAYFGRARCPSNLKPCQQRNAHITQGMSCL